MDEATLAVFDITVPAVSPDATFTVTVKLAVAFNARLAIEHVIVPVPPELGVLHVHPAGNVRELNVKFAGLAGKGIVKTTLLEAAGPLFVIDTA